MDVQRFCMNCSLDVSSSSTNQEIGWMESISVKVGVNDQSQFSSSNRNKEVEQHVPIFDALSCLFPSSPIASMIQNPEELVMCMDCGAALCTLFGAYFQLLNLSNTNSRITELVRQIEIWHSTNTLLTSTHDSSASEILDAYITALKQDFTPVKFEEQEIESTIKDEYGTSIDLAQTLDDNHQSVTAFVESLELTGENCINRKQSNQSTVLEAHRVKKPKVQEVLQEGYVPHLNAVVIVVKPPNGESIPAKNSASPRQRRAALRQSKTEKTGVKELVRGRVPKSRRKQSVRVRITREVPEGGGDEHESAPQTETLILIPKPKKNLIPKEFPCTIDECSESFFLKWELERHKLRVHENIKPSRCELCMFEYFDEQSFKSHYCRLGELKSYRCKYCGFLFKNRADYKSHKLSHEQRELWKCTAKGCERVYYTPKSLAHHFGRAHPGTSKPELPKEEPKVKCPIEGCARSFITQNYVDKHIIREHSGIPKKTVLKILCPEPECGRMVLKHQLKVHIRTAHSNERNYVCEACGKSFKVSAQLSRHRLYKHSSIRRYKCPLCNVSFKGPQELRTHWKGKIHSPEETAELLKSKVVPNVGPDEIPILPPKKCYNKSK